VGTGLGLAIVRELALAMGGDVAVATSSRGTDFTLRLPLPGANEHDVLHAFTEA
jgi:signal transduction histidine kinase